ncbi:MAG: hypothetical protein KF858_15360 [Candidatus Sumerlaeia bacterium]|nr:hypothetical protein [Candidatus Sumerlaeia bacterium]
MHLVYFQQSGKPIEGISGSFWVVSAVALPEFKWKALHLRLNGLLRSFQKGNYDPQHSFIDANRLLHARSADTRWSRALCKGLERIVASLEPQFFLVVVDKRATDKPAHPRWLQPLAYNYLMKPITQYLREADDTGLFVCPVGRPDELDVLTEIQHENLFGHHGRTSPLIATPTLQRLQDSAGLQVAHFVANVARRYHESVYPKLYAKQTLHGYDAVINSHYQGFVKPNTYQSPVTDFKGFKIRGYIYLWRRDSRGQLRDDQASSVEIAMPRFHDAEEEAGHN